jgi:hypothetical protein
LFDLSKDPGEKENLFAARKDEVRRLATLLAKIKADAVTRPE